MTSIYVHVHTGCWFTFKEKTANSDGGQWLATREKLSFPTGVR